MPPALQAVLTSSGVNIGLAVIYPAFDAVGDRWPWWNPRIGAPSRYRALALAQSLGFGRSRLPCFAIKSSSPSQSRWQLPLAQAAAATLSWYLSPRLSMAQAMRAVLLAMASSTTLVDLTGFLNERPLARLRADLAALGIERAA